MRRQASQSWLDFQRSFCEASFYCLGAYANRVVITSKAPPPKAELSSRDNIRIQRLDTMSHSRSRSPSTPSEGEIIESGSEMKATTSQPPLNGTSVVDRPTRASTSSALRSPASLRNSRSPRRRRSNTRSRSRSRSSYRDSRGYKRRRGDDYDHHYDSRPSRHEPSPPRRRHDDRPYDRGTRRPKSYYDYDREESYGGGLRYSDEYDRRRDKRQRTHSRSPYHETRKPKQYTSDELVVGAAPLAGEQLVSERRKPVTTARDPNLGAETWENQVDKVSSLHARVTDEYVPFCVLS